MSTLSSTGIVIVVKFRFYRQNYTFDFFRKLFFVPASSVEKSPQGLTQRVYTVHKVYTLYTIYCLLHAYTLVQPGIIKLTPCCLSAKVNFFLTLYFFKNV